MANHMRPLLKRNMAADVPRIAILLGRRCVQQVNKTHRRTGNLWNSRYISSLIELDRYLLTCQRYIEPIPARAALVDDPAHCSGTSYRSDALGRSDARLIPRLLHLTTLLLIALCRRHQRLKLAAVP